MFFGKAFREITLLIRWGLFLSTATIFCGCSGSFTIVRKKHHSKHSKYQWFSSCNSCFSPLIPFYIFFFQGTKSKHPSTTLKTAGWQYIEYIFCGCERKGRDSVILLQPPQDAIHHPSQHWQDAERSCSACRWWQEKFHQAHHKPGVYFEAQLIFRDTIWLQLGGWEENNEEATQAKHAVQTA